MVSDLKFKSSIHFDFIFVYGVKKWSGLILLCVVVVFPTLLRRPHYIFFVIG